MKMLYEDVIKRTILKSRYIKMRSRIYVIAYLNFDISYIYLTWQHSR